MLPFLRERFESIFAQTFSDWELFVYDSFSDDGAWEYIQEMAAREPRMRIAQGPRLGPYPAWNHCLEQTTAEFVYIATSDDTMAPDCLQKLVQALERNPKCELAHCPLIEIDEKGSVTPRAKWPDGTAFGTGMMEKIHQPHIRQAPYDGLLHLTGKHVYLSITQLLIRRSLFSRIGNFKSTWGSASDFNWEMKAGLTANTVHVPDTWASWRIHQKQATHSLNVFSVEREHNIESMIEDALNACQLHIPPVIGDALNSNWRSKSKDMRLYYSYLRRRRSSFQRRLFQILKLFSRSAAIRAEIFGRFIGRPKWPDRMPAELRIWLASNAHDAIQRIE